MDIGLGFSTAKNSVLAAQEATRLAKMNMKEKIDLAVAFSSTDISSTNLLNTIATSLGTEVPLIGLSGLAIISNQSISTHGLVLLLLKFPEGVHFNTAYTKDVNERSTLAGEEMGEKLLYGFQDIPRALAMIFSDGLIEAGSNFIYGLQERLGRSFPVTGASAPDSVFLKSHLYFNREVSTNGCAGILWGGKLNFSLGIKHGSKP
ncbi:MAG: FIST N-terminal domain-containing protein, partial [Candidatus Omnitrophica bacterium]|nr:FIST N-terminal domain-containing protein [Candidatus Omnitrophota bacterium]